MDTISSALVAIVMFWNLENFFIPSVDSATDVDFTPSGEKHWTWNRFHKKCNDIVKIVLLTKEKYGKYPSIIGLCEVENRKALNSLLYDTPLAKLGYGILHKESGDHRGIDVALFYRKEECRIIENRFFPVISKEGDTIPTRDILYAQILMNEIDTFHVMVNHWPSKMGGEAISLPKRMAASQRVKLLCSEILENNGGANIIVMGDFNDNEMGKPLKNIDNLLNMSIIKDSILKTLPGCERRKRAVSDYFVEGTYKYKGVWESIDHFLISRGMYSGRWLFTGDDSIEYLITRYLLEEDILYGGFRTRRTYIGPRYNGGVSDHLPIILKVYERK